MKILDLTKDTEFLANDVRKKLLYDSQDVRFVLFCLEANQEIPPHTAPSSVSMLLVDGEGEFLGDGEDTEGKAKTLCVFAPEEPHGFRAKKRSVILAAITPRP